MTGVPSATTGENVQSHGFGYDTAYNPTRFDYFDHSSGTDLTYSGLGFTSDNQHSTGDFGATFGFDGNGNPTTYKNAGFSFDPEDRLTAISSPVFSASYDGDGLRATKTANGVTTYFIYDGSTPVTEETWNGTSATVTATNGYAADGWRARYEGSVAYDYMYDPQGNLVQRQTKTAYNQGLGAFDQTIYEAYGALRSDTLVTINTAGGAATSPRDPVGFGGQYGYYTDKETGLLCLTHRYYDPGTGRFINRDPIGYQGGVNLYGFAGGNPVNGIDPNGTTSLWWYFWDTANKQFNPFAKQSPDPLTNTSHDPAQSSLRITQEQELDKLSSGKLPYNDLNRMGAAVRDWRLDQATKGSKMAFKGNVAAFKLKDGTIRCFQNQNMFPHAERAGIIQLLDNEKIDPKNVVAVYSELEPCEIPTAAAGCKMLLERRLPGIPVFYSFEYGATAASRAAGVAELVRALAGLAKWTK